MNRFVLLVISLVMSSFLNAQIRVVRVNDHVDYVDDVGTTGAQNAVKKAHQMTDLVFVPMRSFVANSNKSYEAGKQCKGMLYSSVKEINTFVGSDVSIHTFMTAVHNPRSVLYTEDVSKLPYHGGKASAYYGTVCSSFVSYALGLNANLKSYDFGKVDYMSLVEDQSANGIQLADVLWRKGHVALVTGIRRNKKTGEVVWVEYSEAWGSGCRRVEKNGKEDFDQMLLNGKWKIYRYRDLEKNTYTPFAEFVAVEGEQMTPFKYNDDLCPNRGDKSCYVSGDSVVINVFNTNNYDKMSVYKDSRLFKEIGVLNNNNVVLADLPYGDYMAVLTGRLGESDCVYWKVIDVQVDVDKKRGQICFHSNNAIPLYLEFCAINGGRPEWGLYEFTESDIVKGCVNTDSLPYSKNLKKTKIELYVRVCFSCDYGRVINHPILWKKGKNNKKATTNDTSDDSID